MKQRRRSSKLPLIAGAALFVIALVGFFSAYVSARSEAKIVVAAKPLPAFQQVSEGDIVFQGVPKSSITEGDITEEEFNERYGKDRLFVPTSYILQGERVQEGNAAKDPKASFAIVSPDERVVAVTASISGAAVGTIHAGDIVDVTQSGSATGGGASANFAKVLCISDRADGCKDVIAPGVSVSASTESTGNDDEPVNVLLAVADEDAPALAGQAVALALNPFCEVNETGAFDTRKGSQIKCQIDPDEADREAAKSAQAVSPTEDADSAAPAEGDE